MKNYFHFYTSILNNLWICVNILKRIKYEFAEIFHNYSYTPFDKIMAVSKCFQTKILYAFISSLYAC
jgi:hypothetical protein